MPKSNTLKLATLVNNLKNLICLVPPANVENVYLALFITAPGPVQGAGTEVVYSGYARQLVSFGAPAIVGTNAEIKNNANIAFATCTAPSGTFAYAGLFSALTGGTLLYYTSLGVTYTLLEGSQPLVPTGTLTVFEY